MRFEGEALLAVLRKQTQSFQLCDAAGVPFANIDLQGLASHFGCAIDDLEVERGFVGVGNKKRIRYLQATNPSVWGSGWRGGSHTTRPVRADQTCRVYKHGQLMPLLQEHK